MESESGFHSTLFLTEDGNWIKGPNFSAEDLHFWVSAMESFLHQFQIPIAQHVHFASFYIIGPASKVVQSNMDSICEMNWSEFMDFLYSEFDDSTSVQADVMVNSVEREGEPTRENGQGTDFAEGFARLVHYPLEGMINYLIVADYTAHSDHIIIPARDIILMDAIQSANSVPKGDPIANHSSQVDKRYEPLFDCHILHIAITGIMNKPKFFGSAVRCYCARIIGSKNETLSSICV